MNRTAAFISFDRVELLDRRLSCSVILLGPLLLTLMLSGKPDGSAARRAMRNAAAAATACDAGSAD